MLSVHQSGNNRLHSTETLGILFTDHLYKAIDDGKVTAVLIIDLSKAFDSFHHTLLLSKLCKLGVADDALRWFTSYPTDRQQRVRINDALSTPITIRHGVPQGSILGPLLFNLYINDLPSICRTCNVESYVDDSKLFLSFPKREMDGGLQYLTEDLLRVTSWCCHNHLLINPDKTKFCLFGSQQMLSRISIPPLPFLGKTLHVEVAIKDLGVILDRNLSFTEHEDTLASNLVKKLCMLSRHLLDTSAMFIVINSLVFSKLSYCSSVWSGTYKGNVNKLQLIQNFADRILSGKRKYEHITPTLKQLKLLPVIDILCIRDATQMYKCMNNLAPKYLTQFFCKRSSIHNYNTRGREGFATPKMQDSAGPTIF